MLKMRPAARGHASGGPQACVGARAIFHPRAQRQPELSWLMLLGSFMPKEAALLINILQWPSTLPCSAHANSVLYWHTTCFAVCWPPFVMNALTATPRGTQIWGQASRHLGESLRMSPTMPDVHALPSSASPPWAACSAAAFVALSCRALSTHTAPSSPSVLHWSSSASADTTAAAPRSAEEAGEEDEADAQASAAARRAKICNLAIVCDHLVVS
mmetsp:Transcript_155581/g.498994  ORF Transcript_155581/g.498994 Transcript_155581/m.498994 type:complete len:215 (+) Transcript_155581:86-730(+)